MKVAFKRSFKLKRPLTELVDIDEVCSLPIEKHLQSD